MNKQGLEAWDERFNHIDDNHFKKGCRIEQWYELDRDIPNGLLRNGHILDSGFPSVDPDTSNSDESDDSGLGNSSGNTQVHSPDAFPAEHSAPTRTEQHGDDKGSGGGSSRGSAWFCVSTYPIDPSVIVEIPAHKFKV